MTLQILTVTIFCVLYFIDMMVGIINANKPRKHSLIGSIINSILFIVFLGISTAWTFNFWGWFLIILAIIVTIIEAHHPVKEYGSIALTISAKTMGILLLYLAGFFNCL